MPMIDGVAVKGKCIIIPYLLQKKTPKQLYSNQMGTVKTCLLMRESVYWVNMNTIIEQMVK